MVAARAQCGQGWVVDGYGDCNAGLPRQLMVLGGTLGAGLGDAYNWAGGPVDIVWFGS